MKRVTLLLPLLLFVACGGALYAQIDLTVTDKPVGIGPALVVADSVRNVVHVLTTGIDVGFDGQYKPGEGDVSAAWYVLDNNGNAIDSLIFDGFFNSFPVRVGFDMERGLMYAPVNGSVGSFSLETVEAVDRKLIDEPYGSVSYDPSSDILVLSRPDPSFTGPGTVAYVDGESLVSLGEVESGVNPGMSLGVPRPDIGGIGLFTINEGSFGQEDASLTRTAFSNDLFGRVNGETLGGGAADMLVRDGKAYILLGGSHQVRILDVKTHRQMGISPINVGTSGFDSPRALALYGNTLLVGTYRDDIRRFDLTTGAMIDSIPTPGKVEDITVVGDRLFAAVEYGAGSYDADSLLLVVDLKTGMPIDTVTVLEQPGAVVGDENTGRVVLIGYRDGEARWRSIDAGTLETEAEGAIGVELQFPLRVAYDREKEELAIVGSNGLFTVDITTGGSLPQRVFTGPDDRGELFGVSEAGEYWLVTERPLDFEPEPCFLHLVRKDTGKPVAEILTPGAFLLTAETIPPSEEGETAVYILHEGFFGGSDALLSYAEYAPVSLEGELGGDANHIVRGRASDGSPETVVTMNGSHEVVYLDLDKPGNGHPEIVSRVSTGTSGVDGPRESAIPQGFPDWLHNPLLVTVYTGELLLIANGEVVAHQEIGGKGEGIGLLDGRAYVANAFETGTYDEAATVSVVSFLLSSVHNGDGVAGTALGQNYPNPVQRWTTLPFSLASRSDVTVELYNMQGRLVATPLNRVVESGGHELLLDGRGLTPGSYLYVLRVGDSRFSKRLEVVR